VSDDGRGRWRQLKSYTFQAPFEGRLPGLFALAGRFGAAAGGGALVGDFKRIGHFFSEFSESPQARRRIGRARLRSEREQTASVHDSNLPPPITSSHGLV
jgi:hypothetical protein